ncbi:Polyketide cyclase / dehydrase and lipid transport [Pseudonocardia ammonioxydans]|uniref:Polyketide cyclase / dehydrase and lipid transport n=1 Tax=Pseudonocardia ammonioxydans TaxID=260086 RepID=A0A1I4XYD5_PSUAM|nr:SRPBCC family protein [Pseudonocardia ammonioxydans]SFN30931.1 Polyketide cyclase / dehydrase and lipid transport [Pseudonocardia ammonioxydans]
MVGVQRVMTVSAPAGTVLGYLADFGHSEIWDPRTKACTRSDDGGPIEVGATWDQVAVFNGRESELRTTLVERSDSRLVFVGENATVTATDDIVVEPTEDGSIVTYRADVRFKGLLKLAAPLLRPEFQRFGDEVERILPPVLERLTG